MEITDNPTPAQLDTYGKALLSKLRSDWLEVNQWLADNPNEHPHKEPLSFAKFTEIHTEHFNKVKTITPDGIKPYVRGMTESLNTLIGIDIFHVVKVKPDGTQIPVETAASDDR